MTHRKRVTTAAGYIVLAIGALVVAGPLLWIVDTAFKNVSQATSYPPVILPSRLSLRNFAVVVGAGDFRHSIMVSAEVTIGATLLTILIAAPTAYALVRLRQRVFSGLVFGLVLIETVPLVALIVPLFHLLSDVGLYDTVLGLIVVYTGLMVPFATWVNVSFLQSIGPGVEEAALVDGAGLFQRLRYVVLPLMRPALGATALFSSIGAWNQFIVPVVLAESRAETATVYVTQFVTQKIIDWGSLCAACLLIMIPIIIVVAVAQRQLVGGLTMGMLKG